MRWLIPLVVCAACGDNIQVTAAPDAALDAPSGPDALVCAASERICDGACLDVASDEANCGDCGNICHGGEVCKNTACNCPTNFLPGTLIPLGFDQFFNAGVFTIALAPSPTLTSINALFFGYDPSNPLNTDIDLATVALGSTPFVGAGVGLDIQAMKLDTQYVATAGTLRFTKLCDTEIQGTITDATFNGVSLGDITMGQIPMIDPAGCVAHISTINFHVATAPCP
jgi:hypothetical protein